MNEVLNPEDMDAQQLQGLVSSKYAALEEAARKLPLQAWEIGSYLNMAKEQVKEEGGKWMEWIDGANIPHSTAKHWMKLNRSMSVQELGKFPSARQALLSLLPEPDAADAGIDDSYTTEDPPAEPPAKPKGDSPFDPAGEPGTQGEFKEGGPDMPPGQTFEGKDDEGDKKPAEDDLPPPADATDRLRRQIGTLKSKIREQEETIKDLQKQVDELSTENADLTAQIEELAG